MQIDKEEVSQVNSGKRMGGRRGIQTGEQKREIEDAGWTANMRKSRQRRKTEKPAERKGEKGTEEEEMSCGILSMYADRIGRLTRDMAINRSENEGRMNRAEQRLRLRKMRERPQKLIDCAPSSCSRGSLTSAAFSLLPSPDWMTMM